MLYVVRDKLIQLKYYPDLLISKVLFPLQKNQQNQSFDYFHSSYQQVNQLFEVFSIQMVRVNSTIELTFQTYLSTKKGLDHGSETQKREKGATLASVCSLEYSNFSWICQAACFFNRSRA